jgi:hypothetical protein
MKLAGQSRRYSHCYFSCQITVPGQRLPFEVLRHVVSVGLFSVDRIRFLLHSVHVPIHVVATFTAASLFFAFAWPDVCSANALTQTTATQRASPKSNRRMFFSLVFVRIVFRTFNIIDYRREATMFSVGECLRLKSSVCLYHPIPPAHVSVAP